METDAEEAEVIEAATEEAVEEETEVAPVAALEAVLPEEETERFLLTEHYAFSY